MKLASTLAITLALMGGLGSFSAYAATSEKIRFTDQAMKMPAHYEVVAATEFVRSANGFDFALRDFASGQKLKGSCVASVSGGGDAVTTCSYGRPTRKKQHSLVLTKAGGGEHDSSVTGALITSGRQISISGVASQNRALGSTWRFSEGGHQVAILKLVNGKEELQISPGASDRQVQAATTAAFLIRMNEHPTLIAS
jgi:hypothetical protein